MKRILLAIAISGGLLTFAGAGNAQEAGSNQVPLAGTTQEYCQFQDFQNNLYCKDGDIILFQPAQWGNEQLPLLAIYFLCNPNKPIHFNRAAVVCTYQKKSESQFKDADTLAQLAQQQKYQRQMQQQEQLEQQELKELEQEAQPAKP